MKCKKCILSLRIFSYIIWIFLINSQEFVLIVSKDKSSRVWKLYYKCEMKKKNQHIVVSLVHVCVKISFRAVVVESELFSKKSSICHWGAVLFHISAGVNINTGTAYQNPAFVNISPCPCDITQNACDMDCCCDNVRYGTYIFWIEHIIFYFIILLGKIIGYWNHINHWANRLYVTYLSNSQKYTTCTYM